MTLPKKSTVGGIPAITTMDEASRVSRLAYAYLCAKKFVIQQGFGPEIDWQQTRCLDHISESDFLREAAWVVLAGGMRESVIRGCFPRITDAFCNWSSAKEIVASRPLCVTQALLTFNHRKKIAAIADIALHVTQVGFEQLRQALREQTTSYLQCLPFIGPVTSFHLAKNLGLDVVKPDRHLIRLARALDYLSPDQMCRDVASIVGDRLSVVDIVMWRYATLVPRYTSLFTTLSHPVAGNGSRPHTITMVQGARKRDFLRSVKMGTPTLGL